MKVLEDKKWIQGKWIKNQECSDLELRKRMDVFTDLLQRKKTMVCSYPSPTGMIISKAVYINFVENGKEIWINTDENAEFCQYLKSNKQVTGFIFDEESVCGVMLQGQAEVEQREAYIRKSWRSELNDWYPEGMFGGDFKVIHFTIQQFKVFFDSRETYIEL